MGKYKIITLCGSTRFMNEFIIWRKILTAQEYLVLSPEVFKQDEHFDYDLACKHINLDDMHRARIDASDEIFVINKNGYIGESTASEIEYAKSKGLPIRYMENPKDDDALPKKEMMNKILDELVNNVTDDKTERLFSETK